jgi:hypothetical protein
MVPNSDKWIQLRILLFSSVTFKTPTENNFCNKFLCLLLFKDIKCHKEGTKHEPVEIKFFLLFCLVMEESGSVPLTNGSGSRRAKNVRIRVRNTAANVFSKTKICRMLRVKTSEIALTEIYCLFGSSHLLILLPNMEI